MWKWSLLLRLLSITAALGLGLLGLIILTDYVAVAAHQPDSIQQVLESNGAVSLPLKVSIRSATGITDHFVYLPTIQMDYNNTPSIFAIQMYGNLGASSGFTYVISAGAEWIRMPINWSSIEPINTTPGNYNWSNIDDRIQAINDSKVRLVATLDHNPDWAASTPYGPVSNIADLQEFVGAIVARYPLVEYWEFYNEPDNIEFFGLNGAGYAAMLQAIYPVVKTANPNAKVVIGGLAMDWYTDEGGPFDRNFLEDVLANCAGPCFDVANFHYFPFFRNAWEPYGRDIIGKANFIRQMLTAYGYDRPLIATETSWPAGTVWGSPELQARYVPKVYVRSMAAGLLLTNWYALRDTDSSNPGLLQDPGLTPRSAFTAYQTLTAVMRPTHFVRIIPPSETGSTQIEGYEFSTNKPGLDSRLDVYWYDCPSLVVIGLPSDCSDSASLTINDSHIAVIDTLGTKVILNDSDDMQIDGKVTIPAVTTSPIYIDYEP